ncbi:homoserine/homoserine lactone efflux protein [Kushneria phosphatilytica]|uniref:Homoserine/homoserine lactone efflux protein n=1 Tax=Kushneria phosphatilytica TaxID=657387 RepID=A0A1S1NTN5_9GAMM|nr:homoserine/homoserine lactone efflux protein [Kushneria phosphatilytica]OHV08789.1 homoserine/homoserine lactone efflux protein [Kushneria phosphatilytica]QEL12508.1 homoserine/homoserine lactone efflux protein [Kushneria phosphatilytica]
MSPELFWAFLAATLLISITPGAGAINTMSNGLRYGLKRTLPAILGLQVGLGLQLLVVGVGLGTLLASSELAFALIKWIGVAYLIYLGVAKWRERAVSPDEGEIAGPDEPAFRRFATSVLVNVTNPKATIFLIALLPQFLDPSLPRPLQFTVMGVTMIGVDILVMCGFAGLATVIAGWLRSPRQQRLLNRIFGGLFIFVAGLLASYRT